MRHIVWPSIRAPEGILFLKDLFVTVLLLPFLRQRFSLYIGADCLNALAGILLRELGFVRKVVLFDVDYVPRRYVNTIMNRLYHMLNSLSSRRSDIIWCQTTSIALAKERQGIDRRNMLVVPQGVRATSRRTREKSRIQPRLVYLGGLTKSKGVQLVLEALTDIRKDFPEIKFVVVGTGPFESSLRELAQSKGLNSSVEFLGYVADRSRVLSVLAECDIGLAPYVPDPNEASYYGDPGKVKDYLACGLPVIMTRVPSFSREVENAGAGILINYDRHELVTAVSKLLKDKDFPKMCRMNALRLASQYDPSKIFDDAIRKTFQKLA